MDRLRLKEKCPGDEDDELFPEDRISEIPSDSFYTNATSGSSMGDKGPSTQGLKPVDPFPLTSQEEPIIDDETSY